MSFINSEVQPPLANWFKPLVGRRTLSPERVEEARKTTNRAIAIFEQHLYGRQYLVGDALTTADLFAASSLSRGFQYVFDKDWQQSFPQSTRWFKEIVVLPIWKNVVPETTIIENATHHPDDQTAAL